MFMESNLVVACDQENQVHQNFDTTPLPLTMQLESSLYHQLYDGNVCRMLSVYTWIVYCYLQYQCYLSVW